MAYDQTTIETQLGSVQTAITAALTNPKPNWKVGQVSMNQSEYLKMLFNQQKELIEELRRFPSESIDTVQVAIDEFGADRTDYHNEEF